MHMSRRNFIAAASGLLCLLFALPVFADPPDRRLVVEGRRVALVIGNTNYKKGALTNPANDADDMDAFLRSAGFSVTLRKDLDYDGMDKEIKAFGKAITGASVALFYYAGHGVQVKGVNYLVPTDHNIKTEGDVVHQCIALDDVFDAINQAGTTTNVILLDACRDNPFNPNRAVTRGLAAATAPDGTMIAFATRPGQTASDNSGLRNGLWTQELLKSARKPGARLEDVLITARNSVRNLSKKEQVPWENGSLLGTFYFVAPAVRPQGGKVERDPDREATLVLDSTPPGARILVNGADTGKTTPSTLSYELEQPTLRLKITLKHDGYKTQDLTATLERGTQTPANAVLVPISISNTVTVTLAEAKNGKPAITMELRLIPAGPFLMGDDDQSDNKRRTVNLPEYWMQTTHVTVAQYQAFCAATNREMPPEVDFTFGNSTYHWTWAGHENDPIVNVSYADAESFCAWASTKSGRLIRLPSEQEWEKAARGTNGAKWAWGNEGLTTANAGRLLWSSLEGSKQSTCAVGRFISKAYGLSDMAGNAWCWTSSSYDNNKNWRVVRGGSWYVNLARIFRASVRLIYYPADRYNDLGFRVASGPP